MVFFTYFDINISRYITLSDLLFYSIDLVIFYLIIFSLSITAYYLLLYVIGKLYKPTSVLRINRIDYFIDILLSLLLLLSGLSYPRFTLNPDFLFAILLFMVTKWIVINTYQLRISLYKYYKVTVDEEKIKEQEKDNIWVKWFEKNKNTKLIYIVLILTIFLANSRYSKIMEGGEDMAKDEVEFSYNNQFFSTQNKDFFLLGQTYDYLFLYQINDSKTLIIKKDLVENYTVILKDKKGDILIKYVKETILKWKESISNFFSSF